MSPPTSTGSGCRVSQTSPGNGSHRGPETQQEVSYARSLAFSSIVFFIVITSFARAAGLTQAEAISKARQYLATSNQTTRAQLAAELNTYAGDIDAVIAALKPVAPTAVQYGFSGQQHFTVPELQPQYWADQLYACADDQPDARQHADVLNDDLHVERRRRACPRTRSMGSTVGSTQFYDQGSRTSLSATVVRSTPPIGSTVYVRLGRRSAELGQQRLHLHGRDSASLQPKITSPTPGSILTSSTATFTWNTGTGVSQYWPASGNTVGGTQFYDQDRGTSLSATVPACPPTAAPFTSGSSRKSARTGSNSDYTYTATSAALRPRSPARPQDPLSPRRRQHSPGTPAPASPSTG